MPFSLTKDICLFLQCGMLGKNFDMYPHFVYNHQHHSVFGSPRGLKRGTAQPPHPPDNEIIVVV